MGLTPPGREAGELAFWEPIGRVVRTGSWIEQGSSTPDRIELAVSEGRHDDAMRLVRHLPVEAAEIHDLYTSWLRRLPELVGCVTPDPSPHDVAWTAWVAACEAWRPGDALDPVLEAWSSAHDAHLEAVADLIDRVVETLGEHRLGAVWADLQADGIGFYRRTYGPDGDWAASAPRLIQVAIEGMHGHLGGPRRRGEVTVAEHDDRVELSFHTCGSGGRLLAQRSHGVVEGVHDFAWRTPGVCRYCVHCCVLQQLTPIDEFGYPARVITPPVEPGQPCTWTVYRDPALVPDGAYARVGRTRRSREAALPHPRDSLGF